MSGVDPAMALGAGAEAGIVYQANVVQWGVHARWLKFTPHFSRLRTGAVVNVPVSRDNALRGECGRETWDSDAVNSCSVSFRHFFD